MIKRLEDYFGFSGLGANWRTEILAGATTFVTMAYIVFVNPSILREAGIPYQAATIATCLSAALGSILMGAYAKYPIAMAPGMGLNAYFTFVVVKGLGIPWQTALGAVFLSGVLFLVLTLVGVRQWIVEAIPSELYAAVSAGIGLFIAFVGLRNAGIVVANPATIVAMGDLTTPAAALALFGLILIAGLQAWGVRATMLIGMVATSRRLCPEACLRSFSSSFLSTSSITSARWWLSPRRRDSLTKTIGFHAWTASSCATLPRP